MSLLNISDDELALFLFSLWSDVEKGAKIYPKKVFFKYQQEISEFIF